MKGSNARFTCGFASTLTTPWSLLCSPAYVCLFVTTPATHADGGLTDYLRAVGPGVWVGVGWREPQPGVDVGRRFLHFMLVRRPDSA